MASPKRDIRPKIAHADAPQSQSHVIQEPPTSDGFQVVRRGRKKRKVIVGIAQSDDLLKTDPRPNKSVHVSGLSEDVNENSITTYLVKKGIQTEAVERLKSQGRLTRNYRVEVKASSASAIMKPGTWPQDITVRPFFEMRNRVRTPSWCEPDDNDEPENLPDTLVAGEELNLLEDGNTQPKTLDDPPNSENGSSET
jgi:hypothetical protein